MTNTPGRPPPPDSSHVLEDLLNACSSDPLFMPKDTDTPTYPGVRLDLAGFEYNQVQEQLLLQGECTKDISFDRSDQNEILVRTGSEDVYTKAKTFVERNHSLNNMMHTLQEKNDSLQISNLELKGLADDIRQQAFDALQ